MPKDDPFSYPPRGMSREVAARYIGVGATKFDELVKDGRMPKPKRIDFRVVWDRSQLDAAFDDLPLNDEDRRTPAQIALEKLLQNGPTLTRKPTDREKARAEADAIRRAQVKKT